MSFSNTFEGNESSNVSEEEESCDIIEEEYEKEFSSIFGESDNIFEEEESDNTFEKKKSDNIFKEEESSDILEEPISWLSEHLKNKSNPYFANFTEISFFIWHKVQINIRKSPSILLLIKNAYTLSIIDHIQQILKNSKLFSRMYFGPGIEEEDSSELWHRKIWSESSLFSDDTLKVTLS
ncbi:20818_t:CDS:2, partial [Racocetra persica]